MESTVKSQIVNKIYTSQLDKIEEDDRDANSELYMIPVSGHNILVAPGKTIMSDSGVAYCYVYVIQKEKVICKLGVYEKKTDTMPMFFDLSSFPEDSLRLFEEYEMNPSKLIDFEMKETETTSNNVFDYLIRERFPKLKDKQKKLNETYSILHKIYSKDDQDKDMKPILKLISLTRKMEPPVLFLEGLKEKATDKTKFVLTLLALQPFFNVEFQFKQDTEQFENYNKYEEMQRRWKFDAHTIIEVSIDTYEMIGERDKALSVIQEETSKMDTTQEPVPEPEPAPAPEVEEVKTEPILEVEEIKVEPEVEEYKAEPEPATELEEYKVEPEPTKEPLPRPAPVRIGKTKTTKTRKQTKTAPRGTSMNTVIQPSVSLDEIEPRGTSLNTTRKPNLSLNDVTPMESIKETKPKTKAKTKPVTTETNTETKPEKLKLKRISKPKTKATKESKSEPTEE
jgi:hypothetical protein